ncbi:hypothetical protein NPX13_g9378 [Xylaria arbuscula]|uniref:Uncharacterized protein n=1 Tax=Xylaria arbuscula TaxID=114810 RepID=A0A9W8TIY4_9PEZI|nr:hypothetical protein NPX13_g9378 [Xylaria arbuscula]
MAQSLSGESVSPDEDAPTFPQYQKLPAELKLMVWRYGFKHWFKGAHRFRLFVNPKHPTRLAIEPSHKEVEDMSAWRERVRIACVDRWAYAEFKLITKMAKYKPLHRNRGLKQKFPGRPYFDPEEDLVTFKFDYGDTVASLVMLDIEDHRQVFQNIKRIGVEAEFFDKGFKKTKRYMPFRCACEIPHGLDWGSICVNSLYNFLESFQNLEEFYIIYPIKGKWVASTLMNWRKPVKPFWAEFHWRQIDVDHFRRMQGEQRRI